MTIFSCLPVSTVGPSESLDDYIFFEVEALVAESKDDEKKPIGPRLVRRLDGVPGALARRELLMPNLAKPEGYKLILLFIEKDHVPHKEIPENEDDEVARSVRVRDAARRAFVSVHTDQRLRRAAVSASRLDRLTFEAGDL